MMDVEIYGDQIIVIDKGKILCNATPSYLKEKYSEYFRIIKFFCTTAV